jgi:hypothetical protein
MSQIKWTNVGYARNYFDEMCEFAIAPFLFFLLFSTIATITATFARLMMRYEFA